MPPKKRSRKASVAETPPAVKVEEEIGEETPQFEEIDEKNVVLEEFTPNKRRKKLQNAPESTRSSGRGGGSVFHFDDESNQFYPCPKCDLHFNARASRNFHMRIAHHGYVYTPGDELKRFQNEDVEVKKPKGKKFAKKVDKVEDFGNVKIENSEQNVDFEANFCAPGNSQESEIFDNFHFSDDVQDVAVEVEVAGVPEPCDSSLLDHDYAYFGMHVEEEHHEIEEAEQVDEYFEKEQVLAAPASAQPHRRGRPPKAKEDFSISIKLTMSDPQGKYKCYVKDCDWKGGYRSMRAQHMRVIHPEWKMPDRFLLQRITKDNMYIDPKDHVPLYKCHVDGCDWRGNFRATRSAHMRKVHPNIHEERRKAPAGGFVADGQYFCHVEGCEWRGCSRSTRASHMRREHADYVFGQQVDEAGHKVPRTMIQCCECNFECYSQQVLVDHVKRSHGLTFFVHRRFKNKLEFECWLRSVKRAYSIDFKKNPPIRLTTGEQLTYYHCSHTTQPNQQISFRSRYFQNRKRYSMKRKHRPCTAYLKVNESLKGVMTVDGCVEHFGHRMGLPMLRFGKLDRECMGAFLEQKSCGMPMTLDGALEKLRTVEGFQMNYEVVAYEEAYLEQFIQHPNPMISLHQILTEPSTIYHTPLFDPTDFWGVNLVRGLSEEAIARRLQILFNQPGPSSRSDSIDDVIPLVTDYSIGIMTDEMRRIWVEFGCEKTAVVEEVRAIFEGFSISIVFVLVYDDEERARCACLYFSDAPGGEEIFKRLQEVDPRPPKTIVTDCSATWEKIIEKTYGVDLAMDIDLQISEFHMMSLWAYQTERRVQNRHDQYAIVCALRRWIRIPDPMLFDMFAVQLFEALKEMNLESLFALFDKQLSNEAFARRWIPEKRSEITEHSSPLLEVSVRNFRELFLDNSAVGRFDQYVGLVFHRILEFNRTPKLELYTQRPIDLPRIVPFLSSSEPRDSSPLPAEQEEVDPEQAEEPLGEKSLRELPHDPAFGYEHEHLNPEVEMEEGIQPLMVDGSLKLAKEEAIDEDDEFVLVEVDEHHETTPEMNVDMTPNEQLGAFFCAEAFEIPIEDMECDEIILEAAPE